MFVFFMNFLCQTFHIEIGFISYSYQLKQHSLVVVIHQPLTKENIGLLYRILFSMNFNIPVNQVNHYPKIIDNILGHFRPYFTPNEVCTLEPGFLLYLVRIMGNCIHKNHMAMMRMFEIAEKMRLTFSILFNNLMASHDRHFEKEILWCAGLMYIYNHDVANNYRVLDDFSMNLIVPDGRK